MPNSLYQTATRQCQTEKEGTPLRVEFSCLRYKKLWIVTFVMSCVQGIHLNRSWKTLPIETYSCYCSITHFIGMLRYTWTCIVVCTCIINFQVCYVVAKPVSVYPSLTLNLNSQTEGALQVILMKVGFSFSTYQIHFGSSWPILTRVLLFGICTGWCGRVLLREYFQSDFQLSCT